MIDPSEKRPRSKPRASVSLIAVPVVVVSAVCLTPVVVAGFGLSRLVRGRVRDVGTDSIQAGRALWRATGAALQAIAGHPDAGR